MNVPFVFSLLRRMNDKIKKRKGSVKSICKEIVNDCWNGKYFVAGHHFNQFWSRDFGWCSNSLVDLGYKEKVIKTLRNVFTLFKKQGVKVLIYNDKAIDYPYFAVDSLPWLVRALKISGLREFKSFIEKEAIKLSKLIDKNTYLIKRGYFASIRDCAIRNSSTYNNTMIAMLSEDLDFLGFKNPFERFHIKRHILEKLWNGSYFNDDLNGGFSTDALLFPFITGIFKDKGMIKSCINKIIEKGLDKPLPLKYSNEDIKNSIKGYSLIKNYQGNIIWTHIGPLFINLLKKIKPNLASKHIHSYENLVKLYGTYPEVLNNDMTLFKTFFYKSDFDMLWSVNLLDLL